MILPGVFFFTNLSPECFYEPFPGVFFFTPSIQFSKPYYIIIISLSHDNYISVMLQSYPFLDGITPLFVIYPVKVRKNIKTVLAVQGVLWDNETMSDGLEGLTHDTTKNCSDERFLH